MFFHSKQLRQVMQEKKLTTLILRRLQLVTALLLKFKKSSKVSASVLHKLFNDSIEKSDFPRNLKLADITPVYKKIDPLDKTNYRPVSVLTVVSKISERIMQKPINNFIISFLFPYLFGYRKCFNTEHALLTLVEN